METGSRPPSPRRKPVVGHLMEFRRDPVGFLLESARVHGDIVYFKFGPKEIFLINHPDYIRDVLVTHNRNFVKSRGLEMAKRFLGEGLLTSEGEFHRRQRRLAQPAFHHKRVNAYAEAMADYAARTGERWRAGETLDMSQEMMRLTLAIVGKTLFDADVESEAKEIGEALTDIMQLFDRITTPFPWLLEKLPLPSNFRFVKAKRRLDATIYRIINERRASGEDRGDLLSMLLLAQDEEGDGGSMTDLQLRDEAMTIFLAGHETTANALTWAWYLISQHPEVEAKLHAEIDSALGGHLPSAEDMAKLRYTEMVFAEAMRLYPPAWTLGRRALEDYRIGEYVVPSDSIILMSQYVMHHDGRYYPDPYKFDPERWTPEARAARPKFSYFPFGGGPRVCIGEQFAWMEGVLLIATIAQRWKMRLAEGQRVETKPMITLRPRYGMRMTLERRQGLIARPHTAFPATAAHASETGAGAVLN
ncbi:MAG TPA: cytochrome P450 [Blastocatellia bacterium]|nr:cytochrome P450 [Blastocatellia bacterium]